METKVLVTGATGAIGSNTVKHLLELNVPVRAMVHQKDERSAALSELGAEIVLGDLTDFQTVSTAMKGVNRALFLYPVAPGLIEATAYFAQVAIEENLELVVNISQRTAVRDALSHSAQAHWMAEGLLSRSGVPVTHLQPTLFMDWLAYFAQEIKTHNRYITPFGDARFGIINSIDIGRVAAAVLANPTAHQGKSYRLYGPLEMTGFDVAEVLSAKLNRKINYDPITPEEFGDVLRSVGTPEYRVSHLVKVGHMFQSGTFTGMNNNVELISGTKPLWVEDFIAANIELF